MTSHKIFPVIVLYRCSLFESRTYVTFLQNCHNGDFLVYDNSPADYIVSDLPAGAHYIRDMENSGLPKAYNAGAKLAKELGYARVLLLDQDTEFPPGAFSRYLEQAESDAVLAPNIITTLGKAFSPSDMDCFYPKPRLLAPGSYSLRKYNAVNSGMCIPVDDFLRAGGYDEAVRLDFADFYFQYRLREVNPRLIVLPFQAVQDFSSDCKNKEQLANRYKMFLDSAVGCRYRKGTFSYFQHAYIVLRRTASLTIRNLSVKYIFLYFRNYLLRK